jgi:hypothetical protein
MKYSIATDKWTTIKDRNRWQEIRFQCKRYFYYSELSTIYRINLPSNHNQNGAEQEQIKFRWTELVF